jgi:hypothetical protein
VNKKLDPGLAKNLQKVNKAVIDPSKLAGKQLDPNLTKNLKLNINKMPTSPSKLCGWGGGWGWGGYYGGYYGPWSGWWNCGYSNPWAWNVYDPWYYSTTSYWIVPYYLPADPIVVDYTLPVVQPAPQLIVENAAANGQEVRFLVDGNLQVLQAGERLELEAAAPLTIDFSRGEGLNQAQYQLAGGLYTFTLADAGWDLVGQQP